MMISQVQHTKPPLWLSSVRILTRASRDLRTLCNCRGLGRRDKCTLSGQEKTQHSAASKTSLCIMNTAATSRLTDTAPRVPPVNVLSGRWTCWGLDRTCRDPSRPVLLLAIAIAIATPAAPRHPSLPAFSQTQITLQTDSREYKEHIKRFCYPSVSKNKYPDYSVSCSDKSWPQSQTKMHILPTIIH